MGNIVRCLLYLVLLFFQFLITNSLENNDTPIFSPRKMKIYRNSSENIDLGVLLTEQIWIPAGDFWFGSDIKENRKILPKSVTDGQPARLKKVRVKEGFWVDIDCVTNRQFQEFIVATNYITEAQHLGWSFVFENLATESLKKAVDSSVRKGGHTEGEEGNDGGNSYSQSLDFHGNKLPKQGLGRVQDALHWLGVVGADWMHPNGPDSVIYEVAKNIDGQKMEADDINDMMDFPVVQVSYTDAIEYCNWAGNGLCTLPTEKQWEYAARGGRVNESFYWDIEDDEDTQAAVTTHMNIWGGNKFPKENDLLDGYVGVAPVKSYIPNDYGLYNMLGNVWEWTKGGTKEKRILRGGSFVDSYSGKFNHIVRTSTRQTNSGDSTASNIGFRCLCKGEENAINPMRRKRTFYQEVDVNPEL